MVIVILMLDLWLAKDNRFLNPKSSYKRIHAWQDTCASRLVFLHSSIARDGFPFLSFSIFFLFLRLVLTHLHVSLVFLFACLYFL